MESPLRVVLDTNVLISALARFGYSREFIFALLSENVKIVLSDYILSEIEDVLRRNKFKDKPILHTLKDFITRDVDLVQVSFKISKTPLRDPKDHPILRTAQKGRAQFIITGDEDLLTLKSYRNINIVSMIEFLELLKSL